MKKQVEIRNTFSSDVIDAYQDFLLSSLKLQEILQKEQIAFYKKRIEEINTEIKNKPNTRRICVITFG